MEALVHVANRTVSRAGIGFRISQFLLLGFPRVPWQASSAGPAPVDGLRQEDEVDPGHDGGAQVARRGQVAPDAARQNRQPGRAHALLGHDEELAPEREARRARDLLAPLRQRALRRLRGEKGVALGF